MKRVLFLIVMVLFAISAMAQKASSPFQKFHQPNNLIHGFYQDGMLKMDSMVQVISMGDDLEFEFIASYTYNGNGQLIENTEKETDYETGELLPDYRYTYHYDGEKLLAEMNYEWDTTTSDWIADDSTIYTYDGDLITQEDFYWWDEENSEWDHDFITYYYYTGNILDSIMETIWNGSEYDKNLMEHYSYDGNQIIEKIEQFWNGSEWVNDYRTTYSWDGDKPTNYIEQIYVDSLDDWVNQTKYTYTWEVNGNLNEEIDYNWNTEQEQWQESMKIDGVYDNTYTREDLVLPFFEGEDGSPLMFFDHKIDSVYMYNFDSVWSTMGEITFHYSEFVGIENLNQSQSYNIQVYPIPAKEQITIVSNENRMVEAMICDATGRIINTYKFQNKITIDLKGLAPGMYFVKTKESHSKASKFIVQ